MSMGSWVMIDKNRQTHRDHNFIYVEDKQIHMSVIVCFFLYPINVTTTETIRPIFYGNSHDPIESACGS